MTSDLTDELHAHLAAEAAPGGAAAIWWEDRLATAAVGLSSTRTGVPVRDETLFQIGSITKVAVAIAVLVLVESGQVDLDAPARRYLPELAVADKSAAERVTVGDLLSHRGGWAGDFIALTGSGDDALARYVELMRDLPQIVPPGTCFSYSNSGFSVLGRILERVCGEPFEAAIARLVLGPLGMRSARFSAAETIAGWFAVGHDHGGAGANVLEPWQLPRANWPAGGVVATAADLVRIGAAFAGAAAPLGADAQALMTTPTADAAGAQNLADDVGLGWMLADIAGTRVLSHAGSTVGQQALLVAVPAASFAVAVTVNAGSGDGPAERVCRWALRECLGLEETVPGAEPFGEGALPSLTGRYESTLSGVTLAPDGDGLRLTSEPKPLVPGMPPFGSPISARVEQIGPDLLRLADGPTAGSRIRVIRGAAGDVTALRYEGRLAVRA